MSTIRNGAGKGIAVSTAWLGLGLGLICAGPAAATGAGGGLPAATSSVECNHANGPYSTDASECTVSGAHAIIAGEPYVNMMTQAGDGSNLPENARATLTYSFEVTGGTAGDLVAISIGTNLFTAANYPNYASAEIYTDGSGADAASAIVCTDGSCLLGSAFDGSLHLLSASGAIRTITIFIQAGEGFGTAIKGDAVANADPFIGIDPIGLNPDIYSIEVSPGIANALPGVPEPASWAMLLLGFGGLGAMMRSQRRRVVAA